MFDNITNSLSKVFNSFAGKKFISEENLNDAMREIRIALLEADVSLPIAKEFINKIKAEAIGKEVLKTVSPSQMIIKIVNDQMVELLGSEKSEINISVKPPVVLMMVGLQGAGKTTTAAKLAYHFFNKFGKKRILLASLDTNRPAAQQQLQILAGKAGVDSLEIIAGQKATDITKRAVDHAKEFNYDILILDTAGRIHIDEELMQEVSEIKTISNPTETILVVDSLIGQDAVNVANSFKDKLGIDGIILTRIDGDSRGGAAITMKMATGCPIKFLGSGEKISELEAFDPTRIAGRILGMGDIVSLVEKASEHFDEEEMKKAEKKMRKGQFDLNDLLAQIKNMKKMGGLGGILKFLPGAGQIKEQLSNPKVEQEIKKQEALINSMTPKERSRPDILNSSRKKRIAIGSGGTIQEVNSLLKKLKTMQKMMGKVGKMDPDSMKAMMNKLDK
ncbi:MAG: signal recognition particle subunit SRP54 [Rickettsiales bacterium]|jgi:signal recognition particle subunit SRP54